MGGSGREPLTDLRAGQFTMPSNVLGATEEQATEGAGPVGIFWEIPPQPTGSRHFVEEPRLYGGDNSRGNPGVVQSAKGLPVLKWGPHFRPPRQPGGPVLVHRASTPPGGPQRTVGHRLEASPADPGLTPLNLPLCLRAPIL